MKRIFIYLPLTCLSLLLTGRPACCAEADGPPALSPVPLPGPGVTNAAGAPELPAARRTRRLEEAELKDLLTSTLQREQIRSSGELELRLGRAWSPLTVPEGPLVAKILELPLNGIAPNFILRFELHSGTQTLGTWQLPLQARVWRELWVARSPQPRGRLVREADLGTERRDVLVLRDALLSIDFNNDALELAETIPTGSALLLRSVRVRPVVRRGKVIEAVVQDGLLSISSKVEALEDGVPGQTIRVRNTQSKRELHGKVQNEQTVLVNL